MIESFKKKAWTFKHDYNTRIGIVRVLTKGLQNLCFHVWIFHLSKLVHCTILSLNVFLKRILKLPSYESDQFGGS